MSTRMMSGTVAAISCRACASVEAQVTVNPSRSTRSLRAVEMSSSSSTIRARGPDGRDCMRGWDSSVCALPVPDTSGSTSLIIAPIRGSIDAGRLPRPMKVLVTDDDADSRELVRLTLAMHKIQVVEAAGGTECLKVAQDAHP